MVLRNAFEELATEATLDTVAKEATLDTVAKEATLAELLAAIDDGSADTVLAILKAILNKDQASETTLAALAGEDFAQESTQAAVRAAAEAVQANTDAVEALLTELRDNQLRRSDPLAAGDNRIGYVTDSVMQHIAAGRTFIGGAHRIAVATGSQLWLVLTNASVDKTLTVVAVTTYASSTEPCWVDFFKNTDDDEAAATALTPWCTNFGGAFTSDARLTHHTSVTAQGTALNAGALTTRNAPWSYQGLPIVLVPGQSVGARVSVPGGLSGGADISANAIYIEQPI